MQYWKLLDSKGNPVAPLEFDGKTQSDVVKEIVDAFSSYDVVFFISPTGTGKSAIAMNVIANAFSAGIIVVPTKHLQKQYYNDFNPETGKFKIKGIDIRFILGRNNFTCPYMNNTVTCDNPTLPCTRRLDKFEPRYKVAGECCPYWCPRYPDKESLVNKVEQVTGKMPVKYRTAAGEYVIFMGDDPEDDCPYLRQYRAYVEANVIVMNDKLWLIETLARRKPIFIGGIEVWDEGDSLLEKLITATTISERKFKQFIAGELQTMWSKIMIVAKGDVLREYIYEFISKLEDRISKISNDEEAEALLWKVRKIIDEYDEYIIRIEPKEKKIYFFYKNVAEYLRKILRLSNQKILIMSATLQDKKVLEEYYGFDNYTIIYGKTKYPGKIYILKTKRWWVTHKTFEKIKDAMVKETMAVVKHAEKHGLKTLIHVHAFKYVNDLPVKLDSSDNDYFEKWLKGEILTLASTRLKRGSDLKDDLCRCMIITKMPYPDKNDIRIKHLFESLPEELAHAVYKDIARRELIQQIGRGLRHDNDWVILAVLDRIALEELKQLNLWEMEEVGSIGEVVKTHS